MTIKNRGGVFGRNPTFNDVDVDGTLTVGGNAVPAANTILVDSDIGSTVQAYDADTAKYDAATAAFTGNLTVDSNVLYVNASTDKVGLGTSSPGRQVTVQAIGSGDNLPVRIVSGNTATSCYIDLQDSTTTANYKVRVGSAGDDLELYAGGSNRLDVQSGGDVKVVSGNLVIGTSGKGIDFSATSDGSGTTTSELFDDYEKGEWTPTVTAGSGTITTVGTVAGYYTKVGNAVFVHGRFTITDNGTGAGYLNIGGLPFMPLGTTQSSAGMIGAGYNNSTAVMSFIRITGNSTTAQMEKYDSSYPVASGQTIAFSAHYYV